MSAFEGKADIGKNSKTVTIKSSERRYLKR